MQDAQLLLGVTEDLLAAGHRLVREHDVLALRQLVELHQPGVQPLVVRVLGGELGLDVVVGADLAALGVDEEHPARLQPALRDDVRGVDVENPGLAAQHDQPVRGLPPATRTQPVAVEDGADDRAVGEAHAGRPVPRLHQARVELVERAAGAGPCPVLFSHASGIIISTACGRLRPPMCSSSSTSSNDAESLAVRACRSGTAA